MSDDLVVATGSNADGTASGFGLGGGAVDIYSDRFVELGFPTSRNPDGSATVANIPFGPGIAGVATNQYRLYALSEVLTVRTRQTCSGKR